MKQIDIIDQSGLNRLKSFLEASNLPHEDLNIEKIGSHSFVFYVEDSGQFLGSGGLEYYGHAALLRSVAVESSARGKKIGQKIIADLKLRAKNKGLRQLFLLTETAPEFFSKIGFHEIDRTSAPDSIKSSTEFLHICPTSAVCMKLEL